MKRLAGKIAVVTGGTRGLGKGIVKALASEGAQVWAIARKEQGLEALKKEVPGVQAMAMDVAESDTASQVLQTVKPDILVLNAGAQPQMGPVYEQDWEQFSRNWHTDVKATFEFGKAAMLMPLSPGSQVIIMSSGAAIAGSIASGGYAGAKRMQWFLAEYFLKEAKALNLGIRFMALLPKQIIGNTELGHHASSGYAARLGISKAQFLERFGTPLTPDKVGDGVVSLLLDDAYRDGLGFAITGENMEKLN